MQNRNWIAKKKTKDQTRVASTVLKARRAHTIARAKSYLEMRKSRESGINFSIVERRACMCYKAQGSFILML